MKPERIAAFADALRARAREIRALCEDTAADRAPVELDQTRQGRLSRMDALQGQAMAMAAQERRRAELARIEAALGRVGAGRFGDCLRCGEPIGEKRLALDPAATLCIECARR